MTRAQWGILANLERHPGLLQKELAEILEVEPITVARLIDRLEARGMVERRADPSDRRCWRLHLTDASRPLMSEIDHQMTDLASICLVNLDSDAVVQTLQQHARAACGTPWPPRRAKHRHPASSVGGHRLRSPKRRRV